MFWKKKQQEELPVGSFVVFAGRKQTMLLSANGMGECVSGAGAIVNHAHYASSNFSRGNSFYPFIAYFETNQSFNSNLKS
jgi:hypothetical protein